MENETTKALSSKVIGVDGAETRSHLDELVRGTVEKTLKAILDTTADRARNLQRSEHSPGRVGIRAHAYAHKLHTKVTEIEFNIPKSRRQPVAT